MNPKNRTFVIVAGVVVLIIAAALIAVLATGGSDDSGDSSASGDSGAEIEQTRPVEVTGEALAPFEDPAADPAVGQASPVVTGQGFDGTAMTIGGAGDKPTLLVFLAHWCPHCNREVPRINELRDAGRFPSDLNIVGISTGINPGRPNWPPSKWFKDMDWTYPVIADGVDMDKGTFIGADAYGVDGFPFMVLMDGDGKVVGRWSGEREPDEVIKLITDNLPAG